MSHCLDIGLECHDLGLGLGLVAVASQNDWGPLDILILGALHHEPCHINVGLDSTKRETLA